MIIAKSGLLKFEYLFSSPEGKAIGILRYSNYIAPPRNGWAAPLFPKRTKAKIEVAEASYSVEHELLSNRAVIPNDRRWFLMEGKREIATADVHVHLFKRTHRKIAVNGAVYELLRKSYVSVRFDVNSHTQRIGHITETTGFSLWKRSFQIDITSGLERSAQLFLFFLVVNTSF